MIHLQKIHYFTLIICLCFSSYSQAITGPLSNLSDFSELYLDLNHSILLNNDVPLDVSDYWLEDSISKAMDLTDEETLKQVKEQAENGDADSQLLLGVVFYFEQKKFADGVKWLLLAAEQGQARAQALMAFAYLFNVGGIPTDIEKGMAWLARAIDQKDPYAYYFKGLLYETGNGVTKNLEQALLNYRIAAELGAVEAMRIMGVRSVLGLGVQKNIEQGAIWVRQAAEQGDSKAWLFLGYLYQHGLGVEKDSLKALNWLEFIPQMFR
ncbi:MAG: sel1 repeat family protein [Methylomicrobium sp.]|nr:sel1 repeat family protein [Methylomicrobium sp.]